MSKRQPGEHVPMPPLEIKRQKLFSPGPMKIGEKQIRTFEAPDGHTYQLRKGEDLVFKKEHLDEERKPYVRLTNDTLVPFESWKKDRLNIQELVDKLDRGRLNRLLKELLTPGSLFGRDVNLSPQDRQQLLLVADLASQHLEPQFEDPDWKLFEKIKKQQADKGLLMSPLFPPSWLVDKGPYGKVELVEARIGTKKTKIQRIGVPSHIFRLYVHKKQLDWLDDTARNATDKRLKGRTTKSLGEELMGLGEMLKDAGTI
ncbi:MAG: hypothetical protein GF349_04420 [Candidatus Magasanikbacteria bacterium]|nr:hypothetical protein [Candidatus Magasanikbacteria bacterium]